RQIAAPRSRSTNAPSTSLPSTSSASRSICAPGGSGKRKMPSSSWSVSCAKVRVVDLVAKTEIDDAHLRAVFREADGVVLLLRLAGLSGAQLSEAAEHGRIDLLGRLVAPLHHVGDRARARDDGLAALDDGRLLAGAHAHGLGGADLHLHL